MIPPLMKVMVLSHDPENDGMVVMATSGQMPAFTVKRLYMGAADSHRFNKPPLPPRGTYGLVATVGGDPRNMTWLGAYHQNLVDAIPNTQADPFSDYHSHFSGHWSYVDGLSGYVSQQYADGSYFVAASGVSLQAVYRHTVDENQNRKQIAFTYEDRNPHPQPAFSYTFVQSGTGFSANVGSSGSLHFIIPKGQSVVISQSNTSALMSIDGSGKVTISAGPSFVLIDQNGNSIVSTASGIVIADNNGNSFSMNSGGMGLTVKHGNQVIVTAGGSPDPVETTGGASTVLNADS